MVSSKTFGFSHRLWRWLERLGFEDDPFALYEAEREHNYSRFSSSIVLTCMTC